MGLKFGLIGAEAVQVKAMKDIKQVRNIYVKYVGLFQNIYAN